MDPKWHEFLNARGGFLHVKVSRKGQSPKATLSWYDADKTDSQTGLQKINNQIILELK